jgi:quercetin dioxygenase-like cupin family protein
MSKSWTDPTWRPQPSLSLVACLLLALSWSLNPAVAQTVQPAPPAVQTPPAQRSPAHVYFGVRTVLSTGETVTGEPIRYPSGAPAQLTAMEITLQPGQQTGWHTHPVPLFGYILEGELTVDYGAKGQRIYRKGDGLAEAMNEAHNGRNLGQNPVTILAVFAGMEGVPNSAAASPPTRQ